MIGKSICHKWLLFLILTTASFGLAAQTVTLTFTAKDAANHYVQLNRVTITNLTKSWQETIYWPDTVLTMLNGTGIDDHTLDGGFALSQNNPNPFSGTTEVSLTTVDEGKVDLDIKDMNGRIIETQNLVSLQPGNHQFRISLSTAGTYVMTARQNGKTSSIKMICNGGGGSNTLDYLGMVQTITVVLKSSTNNPFNFGDMMEYVGYATINGAQAESQRITQTQGSSQTFTLQFSETQIQYQLPSVSTSLVSDISYTSASCGGTVYDDGGASVTARGVCWGTSQNPTVNGNHTNNGSGTGAFTSSITGLAANTTYYVRAYATNSVGTAYGTQRTFTTSADLPTVTTTEVSNVTTTSATCGGTVTSDGGATVTARGVCWSTSQNPTVSDSHTTDGSGTGSFASSLTELVANTTYYVRAYATNCAGTTYGEQRTFTTMLTTPTVTTNTISNITATSATCDGNVTATGGASVTARGVCWSTSQNPTVADSHTTDGGGTGSFTSNISGLSANTTYYVRAYATNSAGTAYGNQVSFATTSSSGSDGLPCSGSPTVSDYDGNTYNTVQIGDQCWMKENLRTTHFSDGVSIPASTSSYSCSSSSSATRCAPNYNENYVPTFGYLYNWAAVMHSALGSYTNPSGIQGICPTGWHVPSKAEWTQLINYVESVPHYLCSVNISMPDYFHYIGKALGAQEGWDGFATLDSCYLNTDQNNNNSTGFSALPAGHFQPGFSSLFGMEAHFSSTSEVNGSHNMVLDICGAGYVITAGSQKCAMNSVRCLRDNGIVPEAQPLPNTSATTSLTTSSVVLNGTISNPNNIPITSKGFIWKASTENEDYTVVNVSGDPLSYELTGLSPNTSYIYHTFVSTAQGTVYGEGVTFSTLAHQLPCPDVATVTDYDGNIYNTVQIGTQCWMKENIRATHYSNGVSIPVGTGTSAISSTVAYRYATNDVNTLGYLYNWPVIEYGTNIYGTPGICPTGWHVPSDAEWTQLTDYISSVPAFCCNSSTYAIAKALAASTSWSSSSNDNCCIGYNLSTNNATGFSALPAGSWIYGNYSCDNSSTSFWSKTKNFSDGNPLTRSLYSLNYNVSQGSSNKHIGLSVRCLKN